MLELNTIHLGNNLDLLKQLADNSVDSVVTDPPYGINFMNKKWDYDVPTVELWQEVYRVLKPGGHILVACGTRTQHRMAVNIEDAGFEIRDIVAWVYGSGFPKSLDISKAIDKRKATSIDESFEFAKFIKKRRLELKITQSEADEFVCNSSTNYSWFEGRKAGQRLPSQNEYQKIKELLNLDDRFDSIIGEEEREVIGKGQAGFLEKNNAFEINNEGYGNYDITAPSTEAAKQYAGFGTALKPAMELWTLARKPLKGTVAENVLKYGTGGLNIDGCRVGTEEIGGGSMPNLNQKDGMQGIYNGTKIGAERLNYDSHIGRFPSNFIHDGSEEVVKMFPSEDGISAARFFYTAKASQSERDMGLYGFEDEEIRGGGGRAESGYDDADEEQQRLKIVSGKYGAVKAKKRNIHPTVKPIELMRYLVRLVTPKGGIVLEPFAGSGSTCIAAKQEKMNYIGMEIDQQYVGIAEARIKSAVVEYDIFDFIEVNNVRDK